VKDRGWIGAGANGAAKLRVAVVDYGAGNLVSIDQALKAVGGDPFLVREPDELEQADALVVPGVGAAAPAMSRLAHRQLVEPIRQWIFHGRPYLGICLGLQLLFETSDEDGAETMGILAGRTAKIEDAPTLPHIGWNQVERRRRHALFDGIIDDADFYFVHSYAGLPEGVSGDAAILGETTHGGRFVSAIDRGNVLGVQFHPERSGGDGIRLLANFVRWATALAAGAGAQFAPTGAGGTGGGD
jgi:imidazole glycerol phosphate synthase glutamine amidotransferase subunit